ncbi:MAG TPA: 3-hydroxyacyl-ACP dehydratase FabZ family protein [Pirellulales bacterium]
MSTLERIISPDAFDLENVIADREAINQVNPQRFEWEQLSAVVHDDPDSQIIVGYRDLTEDQWWCRGHFPGRPLVPGVLICEAAAQLCSYHAQIHDLTNGKTLGFGGLDRVRFREMVSVPSRLVIMAKVVKIRHGTMIVYRFQCYVRDSLVCDGELRGIGLPAL